MNTHHILAALEGRDDPTLFDRADALRQQVFGTEVYIRAIVEFSNVCDKHCHYCGLRADNSRLRRYRLRAEQILASAAAAVDQGAGTVVLQSGDDTSYSAQFIGDLIRRIKSRHDVAVTLSLGDRSLEEYAFWRACGADRCLLKLETTDRERYRRLRQGETFDDRLRRLEGLRALGYELGSGVISGLPGTTLENAAHDIRRLTDLSLDMIAVGPFVPNPDTPLAAQPAGDVDLALRMTAVLRLLNPTANIPATSALDALRPDSRMQALKRGCNVLMPSTTPTAHRRDYRIYPGKNADQLDGDQSLTRAREAITATGLVPSRSKGFAPGRRHVG